jgi:hypothetical protein
MDAFLRSWSNGGEDGTVYVSPSSQPFIDRNVLYVNPYGAPQATPDSETTQWGNYRRFASVIVGAGRMFQNRRALSDGLMSLVAYISSKGRSFANFVWYLRQSFDRMMHNSIVNPEIVVPEAYSRKVVIGLDGPASLLLFANFDPRAPVDHQSDLYLTGIGLHDDFNLFMGVYHVISGMYDDPRWASQFSRKDVLKLTFELLDGKKALFDFLHDSLIGDGLLISTTFPDATTVPGSFTELYESSRRFVENTITQRGVSPWFYYQRQPSVGSDAGTHVQRYVVPTADTPVIRVSYDELVEMQRRRTLARFFREADRDNTLVRFDVAVNYTINRIDGRSWTFPPTRPITPATSTEPTRVSPIPFYYTEDRIIIDDDRSESYGEYLPRFFIPVFPLHGGADTFIQGMLHGIRVVKEPFDFDSVLPKIGRTLA